MTEFGFYLGRRGLPSEHVFQTIDQLLSVSFPLAFDANKNVTSKVLRKSLMRYCSAQTMVILQNHPCGTQYKNRWIWCILFRKISGSQVRFCSIVLLLQEPKATHGYLLASTKTFVNCDMYSDCFEQAKPLLVKVLSLVVFNLNSDIEEDKCVSWAAKRNFFGMTVFNEWEAENVSRLNNGLRPSQKFPVALFQLLCGFFHDAELLEKSSHVPYKQFCEVWHSCLNNLDVTSLFMHEACVWSVP